MNCCIALVSAFELPVKTLQQQCTCSHLKHESSVGSFQDKLKVGTLYSRFTLIKSKLYSRNLHIFTSLKRREVRTGGYTPHFVALYLLLLKMRSCGISTERYVHLNVSTDYNNFFFFFDWTTYIPNFRSTSTIILFLAKVSSIL